MSSSQSYVNQLNYNAQPLFRVIDTFDNEIYPMKEKDPDRFYEIMKETYDQTHKSRISGQKLKEWSEKFPNMIDRKIESEKHKLRKKLKDITKSTKSRKAKERFKTSQLRNRNIMQQLENIGYFAINRNSKMAKMKSGLEDDEIIIDIIGEISDPYGSDHDMVEINYDDQFKRKVQEYEDRYKYVYVVEDVEPIKEKKIPKKKPISKAKLVPKKEERKIVKKPPVKKVKEKLLSSVVLSKNPIKITPIEKLEYVKKKPPVKKKPGVKKKPIKKTPIKKKPIAKEKPIVKAKPIPKKKPIVKKKLAKKKKPIAKEKPIVKAKPIAKKKPIPKKKLAKKKKLVAKKKQMRAKRRNSPITGRWTARYRSINGKKRKVKIRRWKGQIQMKIIK